MPSVGRGRPTHQVPKEGWHRRIPVSALHFPLLLSDSCAGRALSPTLSRGLATAWCCCGLWPPPRLAPSSGHPCPGLCLLQESSSDGCRVHCGGPRAPSTDACGSAKQQVPGDASWAMVHLLMSPVSAGVTAAPRHCFAADSPVSLQMKN